MRSTVLENFRALLIAYRARFRRHEPQQQIDGAVVALDEAIRRLAHVPDHADLDDAEEEEAKAAPKPAPKPKAKTKSTTKPASKPAPTVATKRKARK